MREQDQLTHLKERIAERYRSANQEFKEIKEPPSVRRARTLVRRWDKKQEKAQERHEARVEKVRSKLREMLNFETPEKVLIAVRKFESTKF